MLGASAVAADATILHANSAVNIGPLKDDAKGLSGFRHPGVVLLTFYSLHNTVMRVCCLLQSIAGGDAWN